MDCALQEDLIDTTPRLPDGSLPNAHPMWEKQVELEAQMRSEGLERAEALIVDSGNAGQATRINTIRGAMTGAIPQVADALTGWLKAHATTRGPKPIASKYLAVTEAEAGRSQRCDSADGPKLPPAVAATLALKVILDGCCRKVPRLTDTCIRIGSLVERELQVRHWQAADRKAYANFIRRMDRDGATAGQRARSSTVVYSKWAATTETAKLEDWNDDHRLRVGLALCDAVVRGTGWFTYGPDPEFKPRAGKKSGPAFSILPTAQFAQWLTKATDPEHLMSPAYLPTVIPPRRWEGSRVGGYWCPETKVPNLVRFKASQRTQQKYAADEYDAIHMPEVYSALHALQETPWRVNKRVLEVALALNAEGRGAGKLPTLVHFEERRLPEGATADEIKKHRRATAAAKLRALRSVPKVMAASTCLRIAMQYAEFPEFYFPHMMDFRGRMYPIPTGLQPQGDQLAKGLLEFARGVEITEENDGANWIAVHLASSWGHDKWTFAERIDWVLDNEQMLRNVASDPLNNREWCSADKPFIALAACLDWVAFLNHGYGYKSHLPVAVDGTCNGIQHLSALTRDAVTGELVNLSASDRPRDIYGDVSGEVYQDMVRLSKYGPEDVRALARYWLSLASNGTLPRASVKRQVMVLPYGGTRDSFYEYTREWLDEADPMPDLSALTEEEQRLATTERNKRVTLFVQCLWDAVNRKVKGGMQVMEWLRKCSKAAAVGNQPVFWVTPCGFVVRHFYGKMKSRDIEIMLDGSRVRLSVQEVTKDLDAASQLKGISPNFIHSLDASAMVDTVNRCVREGVVSLTTVHDAYGTHAGNMWPLFRMIREAFVSTHSVDMLGRFRATCQSVLASYLVTAKGLDPQSAFEQADEALPAPIELGTLDLESVMSSDYFFS